MDHYRDHVIPPNDQGEEFKELKRRVMEGDGSDYEGRPTKRPRANTNTLLPPEPEGDRQDSSEPPNPEDNLDKYDRARLQQGLRYINGAAKRKITPRTQEFLRLYKDVYRVALEGEALDKTSCAVVQALDKVYCSGAFYFKSRSPDEHKHLMNYVKLRQLELRANYGDYLGHEAGGGAHSEKSDVLAASSGISGPRQWTTIADELEIDVTSLRKNIHGACAALGMDSDHMLWLIREWAQRNRMFHNFIGDYISGCRWFHVAERLCRDLKELHNVAPDPDTAEKYGRVLLKIQNDYFDIMDPDDAKFWFSNEKAKKLSQERLAKNMKKAQKKLEYL